MRPDEELLKRFYQQLADGPLDTSDPRYVPLYTADPSNDPVELLATAIRWLPKESVQLLSGFRGTGKSTELRRLKRLLEGEGFFVALIDVEDHINVTSPIDVTDFLIAIAGAFGDAFKADDMADADVVREGYWGRALAFLTRTTIEMPELDVSGFQVNLKSDPSFRRTLQERLAGHVGALVKDVHAFFGECVQALRKRQGPDAQVVLLVDSVEHIRGTSTNSDKVQASLETLFASHSDKLKLPNIHVVYTVPPYLKVRYPNLGALYDAGAVQIFPAIKIRHEGNGEPHIDGIDSLRRILERRGNIRQLLGDGQVDEVILCSGGHLRDLLRIVSEILRRARVLPVDPQIVSAAINQIRTEFLPIANADAAWLARIAETHQPSLEDVDHLPDFARFLDTHVVLCYRDGPEWYDVHPLIKKVVREQAGRIPT